MIRVESATPDRAEKWQGRDGVEIPDPRTVIARGEHFWQAWQRLWIP